ncbi:MAG: hypothetical protein WC043_01495 [Pseudobdellovibrionaceae bacterium]
MNKITDLMLNKVNVVNVLVIAALLLFLTHMGIGVVQLVSVSRDPFGVNIGNIMMTLFMQVIGALYPAVIILGVAKIIHMMDKKNAQH